MMTRHVVTIFLAGAMSATLAAQTQPQFEVASIRPSPELTAQAPVGLTISPGQVRFSLLSLKDYLTIAYGLRIHQIVGPDWLGSARFEIAATIPENQKPDQVPAMLRSLLEDRFQLRSHRESREFSVYGLEVAPGASTLVRVPDEAPPEGPFTVTSGIGSGGRFVNLGDGATLMLGRGNRFEAKRVTMLALADLLGRFVDRPVVNMTNLEGRYDVTFELAPEDFRAMMIRSTVAAGVPVAPEVTQSLDTTSPFAVADALRAVGLLLRPRRALQEMLVVDSITRNPSEN